MDRTEELIAAEPHTRKSSVADLREALEQCKLRSLAAGEGGDTPGACLPKAASIAHSAAPATGGAEEGAAAGSGIKAVYSSGARSRSVSRALFDGSAAPVTSSVFRASPFSPPSPGAEGGAPPAGGSAPSTLARGAADADDDDSDDATEALEGRARAAGPAALAAAPPALRALCRRLARQRDEARADAFSQATAALQARLEVDALRRGRDMLLARLETAEAALIGARFGGGGGGGASAADGGDQRPGDDDATAELIAALVEAKLALATKDLELLQERGRVRAAAAAAAGGPAAATAALRRSAGRLPRLRGERAAAARGGSAGAARSGSPVGSIGSTAASAT